MYGAELRLASLWAGSIQPKFWEISVQNSMDRFGPTGKVSKKRVLLLRWTTFPGRTGWNFGWMDRALWFSIDHLIHRSHWSAGKEPIHCGCALVSEQTHPTTYQALSLKSPAKWDACPDKCSFTSIFTHFFEATGPNCFNVLCKILSVLKLIDKSLITKTAAKTVKTMLTTAMFLDVTLDINIWCKSRPSDKGMAPVIQTLSKGGGPSLSIFFSALWASVWSKNKEGGAGVPPGPLPWIRHWLQILNQ